MAAIGAFTMQIWRGELREAKRSVRLHRREGVDGVGMIRGSYLNGLSTITTEATVASEAAALELKAEYRRLQATLVDLVDAAGTRHRNAGVFDVESVHWESPVIDGGAATTDTHVVQARWLLLLPYTPLRQGAGA